MNCDELLNALNEYVDGTIEPGVCQQLVQHLTGCNPCQVVVDNIRQTIRLYRNGEPYELPVDLHQRLHQNLRARWAQVHRSGG